MLEELDLKNAIAGVQLTEDTQAKLIKAGVLPKKDTWRSARYWDEIRKGTTTPRSREKSRGSHALKGYEYA